jgi:hypothetical protein
MSDIDLQSKFPQMQPIRSTPSLFLWNGCGMTLYGRRDFDVDTYTYVKTYCFCLLFLPILALKAFRLADTNRGWVILGRVPLSGLARLWNLFILVGVPCVVGGVLWYFHINSADYRAGQQLAEARRLADDGQVGEAARLCQKVAQGGGVRAAEAMQQLRAILEGPAESAPAAEAATAFQVAVELRRRPGAMVNLFDRGLKVADKRAEADPQGAVAIINAVLPVAPDAKAGLPERRRLLERLVKAEPANVDYAAQLAVVYEAQSQRDRCEALLTPFKGKLGDGEGARILGQIYAHKDKLDEAHALLMPYAEARLDRLHAAEKTLQAAIQKTDKRMLEELKSGKAPDFNYQRYKTAAPAEQQVMVNTYMDKAINEDPECQAALDAVRREDRVVHVAVDLGIILLRRGQMKADPAARRAELEKAERMFLAIRSAAGKTDQYRLNLGQVYYWLGKHQEGRKLFDEMLAEKQRSVETLLGVSILLREVGAISEARSLAEEAYEKETDPTKKAHAARQRSVLMVSLDDQITWLKRSKQDDPDVKGSLATALGDQALEEGRNEEAAQHLREAIATYTSMPESPVSLNNGALAYLSLYRVTGEREAIDKAIAMMEKAVSLRPADSLLLGNLAGNVLEAALWDLIGPAIDLKTLKKSASLDLLSYLYQDRAGRDRLLDRVRKHPGILKAITYLDRVQVLAPRREHTYMQLSALYGATRDADALHRLWAKLKGLELDLSDYARDTIAYYKGTDDAKHLKRLQADVKDLADALKAVRKAGGTTFAVAADSMVREKIGLAAFGQAVDADELVRLAEEAHAAAPSRGSQSNLMGALLFRASQTLAKQAPAYAALLARGQRSVGVSSVIAVALSEKGPARQLALDNPDVKRVLSLVKEAVERFPDEPGEWQWAMLVTPHPKEAAAVAEALRKDEVHRLLRQISQKVSPLSGSGALNAYWASRAAGDEAEAEAAGVIRRAIQQGVPLPIDVK